MEVSGDGVELKTGALVQSVCSPAVGAVVLGCGCWLVFVITEI